MESKNKKAQGMSVTTIILIVLGLIVLVVLIIGFTMGWSSIKQWIAPSNNVEDIVQQCGIACNTNQKFTYCSEARELKSKDETLNDVTCYSLADKKGVYGISKCSAIECGIYSNATSGKATCTEVGKDIQYLDELKVISYQCKSDDLTP
jgi:hypothetical protein